ncbi:MAG: phenylacetate--CoA ligase [Verrucomicrobia bacterium]|nr:phenylacetate--CoA ligase [Verrucomicrobiota bacterium]
MQAAKLRRFLTDVVVPFSPHYRRVFAAQGLDPAQVRTLDDLRRVPFSSKADLLNTPEQPQRSREFIIVPDEKVLRRRPSTLLRALVFGRDVVKRGFESEFRPIFMTSTTGRSADPIPFLFTQHDLANLQVTGDRLFQVCGARSEFRLLNMFPYAPHLAFWQTFFGGTTFGVLTLSSGGGKVMGTEGQIRFIRKLQPDILIGMPTFTYHVLQQAVDETVHWENLKRIVLGGEKVPEGMRRKLTFLAAKLGSPNVDIVTTYGFTEAKMAWAECPTPADAEPSGYHLYPDLGIFEVVDPKTGEPVPDGHPGELVFTPLDARGTVVLRYRTGDCIDGGLTYAPCPHCGRVVPRLLGRISRTAEVKEMRLDKIKGTLVDFNELEHVLDDAPLVGAWQLELRKTHDDPLEVDELILHVQKLNGADESTLVRELNSRFAAHTEVRPNRIEFHTGEAMRDLQGVGTQLKESKLVDHRPKAGQTRPQMKETA